MNETGWLPFRPQAKSPSELQKVQRGLILLRFDEIDPFVLNQPFRQKTGLPGERLRMIARMKEGPYHSVLANSSRFRAQEGGPVFARNPVDDEPPMIVLFECLLGSSPQLTNHMDCLAAFGKQSRHVMYISPNASSKCRRIFAAYDEMVHE